MCLIYTLQIQYSMNGLEGGKGPPGNNTKIKLSESQIFRFIK